MRSKILESVRGVSLALCIAAAPLGADVLQVGSGKPFATPQAAVDAASDGDVVLVSPGTYTGLAIPDLDVAVVADTETGALVKFNLSITVSHLSAGRTVLLSGLTLQGVSSGDRLRLLDNAGAVRVENCTVVGTPDGPGVEIVGSADVALAQCSISLLFNPLLLLSVPGAGLSAVDSTVALYDCTVEGGDGYTNQSTGQARPGAPGLLLQNSQLFASGCTVRGGTGSNGSDCSYPEPVHDGAEGGPGAVLDAASRLDRLSSAISGGFGGLGFPKLGPTACSGVNGPVGPDFELNGGTSVLLAGAARHLELPVPVRDESTVPATLTGQPGDGVGLIFDLAPAHVFEASVHGTLLVGLGPPPHFLALGVIPFSGALQRNLSLAVLDPGVESLTVFLQPLFVDLAGNVYLGSQVTAVIVAPIF